MEILDPLGLSDHCTLSFDCECFPEISDETRLKYFMDRGDYDKFRTGMSINWQVFFHDSSNNIH